MKSLVQQTNLSQMDEECAGLVMETAPMLMHTIRHEMRRQRPEELTLPQFRTLRILQHHPGASLSVVAEHLGLTLATTSKLIDVLVKHNLVARESSATDRRQIVLSLTEQGRHTLETTWQATRQRIAEMLSALSEEDRAAVTRTMTVLQAVLQQQRQPHDHKQQTTDN